MTIAVANFGVFPQGELDGGQVKSQSRPAREPILREVMALFEPRNALAPFSGGVSDTSPKTIIVTHGIRSVCVSYSKKTGESGLSEVSLY